MDMVRLFHMNGGTGVASYSSNSALQRKGILMTKTIIEQAINDMYCNDGNFSETLIVADLGCSCGPNTLLVASMVIKAVEKISLEMGHKPPEIQINLNDLPGNDFNTMLLLFGEFQERLASSSPCYFTAVPGSFYTRLFPAKLLHFVHSSYSLNWLSQIPKVGDINKENIYLSKTTPESVIRAYYGQFQKDMSVFLKCRSEEIVQGGHMVLTLSGRRSDDPCSNECCWIWDLFAMALNDMVYEGIVEEEKLDSFNVPIYTASPTEIMNEVEKEGSFTINRLKISDVNWTACKMKQYDKNESFFGETDTDTDTDTNIDTDTDTNIGTGQDVARGFRAGMESLVVNHFGEEILDEVFMRFEKIVADRISNNEEKRMISITISLIRKC